jgi:hypothetical protein
MSDQPIRTDLPVHADPRILSNLAPVLDQKDSAVGQQAINSARGALGAIHSTMGAIQDVENKLKPIGTTRIINGQTQLVASHPEFGKAANARYSEAFKSIAANTKQLEGAAHLLQTKINEALHDPTASTPTGIALGQEVRAFCKNLSPTERNDFISAAVSSGDKRTINALLSGQSFLSGMDQSAQDNLRARAHQAFAPTEVAQLAATKQAMDYVERAHADLLGKVDRARKLSETPLAKAEDALKKLASG